MEIRIRSYDDKEYDKCGNQTIVVLETDAFSMPLCQECLNELLESIENFKNKKFCKDCEYWYMSRNGSLYGGSCEKMMNKDGVSIKDYPAEEYGYKYYTEFYHECDQK